MPWLRPFFLFVFFLCVLCSTAKGGSFARLGVDYGTLGDDLPSHVRSVELIRSIGAGAVKIYDANPAILRALAGTRLRVSIMVPNDLIPSIGTNASMADAWVATYVAPFAGAVRIRYLLVGNEILSYRDIANSTWPFLVPAIVNVRRALVARSLRDVKVGTTLAMDALSVSYPPSAGKFRADIADSVMRPMLQFLRKTRSFYFVDAYPYFAWAGEPTAINLDYALFAANSSLNYFDPGSKLTYTNLLDQMLDAVAAAMSRLGFRDVRIAIAETGWPNGGDLDQIGANIHNAAIYNRNLARRLAARPAVGTPARPGEAMPVFIFSLYNENQKPGPGTERHWGLLYPNGKRIYPIDLSGRRPVESYPPLPPAENNEPYKGKLWCVLDCGRRRAANATAVGEAVAYACGQGNGTCDAIRHGGACYYPNTLAAHANYAFNAYWQQFRRGGGTCFFDGLAVQTKKDPSYGSCKYPSSSN
ncbi:probable glucan endo-1,3-beta-glucosidase A6 [Zingiber officinale]|uniref:probable glucan endo-1,3-beta-glucosidase A6 n=1 Tax=Zingiber officinale TaxID=94328 RepID=UPI001C4AAA8D|nr:probable glucan endo-1,3-beta-glucosidase A6 [Zingiber officinale]XP_042419103.1 probable glucan endo-1,3-beta-glucosidase A6 [Zingiber officinale]